MKNLHQKTVAITGAASGIGRALALAMARVGVNLGLLDVNPKGLQDTAHSCRSLGVRVLTQVGDVSDAQTMQKFANRLAAEFNCIDILVNNAGVSVSDRVETSNLKDQEWLFAINFWGVVNGCQAFLPYLKKQPEAFIINISSCFGLFAMPGVSAYCASKFAVRGFTDSLRTELLGTSVRVMIVHPGGVSTNIIQNGRHFHDHKGQPVDQLGLAQTFERLALTRPDEAAQAILKAIRKRRTRLLIGSDAYALDLLARLLPSRSLAWVHKVLEKSLNLGATNPKLKKVREIS